MTVTPVPKKCFQLRDGTKRMFNLSIKSPLTNATNWMVFSLVTESSITVELGTSHDLHGHLVNNNKTPSALWKKARDLPGGEEPLAEQLNKAGVQIDREEFVAEDRVKASVRPDGEESVPPNGPKSVFELMEKRLLLLNGLKLMFNLTWMRLPMVKTVITTKKVNLQRILI